MALRYGRSINWVRYHLSRVTVRLRSIQPCRTVLIADITWFKRSFKVCVARSAHLKRNLAWLETPDEKIQRYSQVRNRIEEMGFTITAVVIDGRKGVKDVFADIPVQMCHFHQKAIVNRYLTTRPKLPAGIELRRLTATLCQTTEKIFAYALDAWYTQWNGFLKERSTDPVTGTWQYTHRRLRSAYRSLKINLPYLFTYQRYPKLHIPNTTNSLDGSFAHLKELTKIHRGLNRVMKRKVIDEILGK